VVGNKRSALRHYSSISVQRMHEKRNTLTGHFRNYESILAIPTHRKEIETAKSTTSIYVSLTVVSFSSTAYNREFIRNILVSSEFFLVCRNLNRIKQLYIYRNLKLTNHYTKKSQVHFIHQCQIQYYNYNTNEKSRNSLPKSIFHSFLLNNKKSGIYGKLLQKTRI